MTGCLFLILEYGVFFTFPEIKTKYNQSSTKSREDKFRTSVGHFPKVEPKRQGCGIQRKKVITDIRFIPFER